MALESWRHPGVELDELLRDFIAETREGIEALDSELVRFEQDPDNPELLGEVFRLIHTIKGTCGFIGLARLQGVAHAAETVLGGFRDGSTPVTGEAVSAVLQAVDLVRNLIDDLAQTGVETPGDDRALIERLDAAARATAETPIAAAPIAEPAEPTPTPQSAPAGPLLDRLGGEASLDAACEMTVARLSSIPGAWPLLSSLDPDRLGAALREALCDAARGLGDPDPITARLTGMLGAAPDRDLVLALIEAVGLDLTALDVSALAIAEMAALVEPRETVREFETAPEIETHLDVEIEEPALATIPPREDAPVALEPAASAPPAPPPAASAPADGGAQTIRVDVDALEHLMTVASELVLIRNQLLQLLRLEPESPFAAPLHRLNQVTSELQEGVMTTRMQPISGAWAKLPRLVRDLARDLGKRIDLQMDGQTTELDRQVLELIKDPLTHMIRNAADHGLETPDERVAAGKPETGRIMLSARHEGGAIVIEMADDGRGLSASKIRAKAVSSGIVTAQQAEAMSDAEARRLIFLPGFSTAQAVTAVSGRGVGMDVVRTNIEKIGGVIELSSTEGAGSRFTIRIPLTLTIVSALIIECCGERFAMPQSSVIELVSAGSAGRSIEYIDGTAVLRLRDRLLPLVSLQSLLGLPVDDVRPDETCIVVARVGAFTYGVIVDRVFDTEEIVVKPVSSVLRHLKVYSGATILGDGSVIMILDFKGMSPDDGVGQGATPMEEEPASAAADLVSLLVFRVGEDSLKATRLAEVSRIEEAGEAQIEHVDGRSVIQYRGRLMPVVEADGAPLKRGTTPGARPLLVFSRGDQVVGVVVDEIVDIVESSVATDLSARGDAAAGSLIVGDRATELIDVDFFWRRAFETAPSAAQGQTVGGHLARQRPDRRLLVIDQSPICRVLLQPLLAQAGYEVTIAETPVAALALHDAGAVFDLILAETSMERSSAQRFVQTFARADRWHTTPLLSLGLHRVGEEAQMLEAIMGAMGEDHLEMRGAA